ncbi:MAG TPA: helix-turn-helix transcriptional regulator [Lacipirellulaceae bacterium]|nr:helix-turn-helix transcriptional regulator [Lacipirellulaceae bacterium]
MVTQGVPAHAAHVSPQLQSPLGANVRRLMARFGMTQADVVAATGLDERTVRSLIHGDSQPHARTLHRLAAGLGVPADELFQSPAAGGARFDRATNPAVCRAVQGRPDLFENWTPREFDELYSRVAVGGQLTEAGAIAAAAAMNDRRAILQQVVLILETNEAQHLRDFVAMLHARVTVAPEPAS